MNVSFDFSGQNFLVTGASSGIGRETAKELLKAGAKVLGFARHFTEMDELAEKYCPNWFPQKVDVTDFEAVEKAVAQFVDRQGKISGAVHSAGRGEMVPIIVWNREAAENMMNVNLWAGANLLKLFSKRKYGAEGFAHVFISSVSAHKGQKGLSTYAVSKAGIEALVRTAALEFSSKGQRINSICLGPIETNMTQNNDCGVLEAPLGTGTPEDAAGMILYLLSDRAKWITGANLAVDGGFLA